MNWQMVEQDTILQYN